MLIYFISIPESNRAAGTFALENFRSSFSLVCYGAVIRGNYSTSSHAYSARSQIEVTNRVGYVDVKTEVMRLNFEENFLQI